MTVRAEEARRRAQHALEERESDISMAAAAAELQRALVRLKAADKRRRRTGVRRPESDPRRGYHHAIGELPAPSYRQCPYRYCHFECSEKARSSGR